MSIASNFPVSSPTLNLDFANSQVVDPRITFTRASTATYTDKLGLLAYSSANSPRIDFDPITTACKGLLIEEQRTNLMTYSEDVSSAYTGLTNATVTADAITSPAGTTTADFVYATTTGSTDVRINKTTSGTVANTYSTYAKAGTISFLQLTVRDVDVAGNSVKAEFNLSTGAISVAASNTGTATGATATITSVGNGWYRCSIAGIVGGTGLKVLSAPREISNNNTVTAGLGIYIWGAQLEVGEFPTSYIPTTTAQVTRSADAATMTGTNFSSWYNASEGTLYSYYDVIGFVSASAFPVSVSISDGTVSNYISLSNTNTGSNLYAYPSVLVSGVGQYAMYGGTAKAFSTNTLVQSCLSYAVNDALYSVSGLATQSDTSCLVPTVNKLNIGIAANGVGGFINGHIRRIAYYPTRLSNVNLPAMTS